MSKKHDTTIKELRVKLFRLNEAKTETLQAVNMQESDLKVANEEVAAAIGSGKSTDSSLEKASKIRETIANSKPLLSAIEENIESVNAQIEELLEVKRQERLSEMQENTDAELVEMVRDLESLFKRASKIFGVTRRYRIELNDDYQRGHGLSFRGIPVEVILSKTTDWLRVITDGSQSREIVQKATIMGNVDRKNYAQKFFIEAVNEKTQDENTQNTP